MVLFYLHRIQNRIPDWSHTDWDIPRNPEAFHKPFDIYWSSPHQDYPACWGWLQKTLRVSKTSYYGLVPPLLGSRNRSIEAIPVSDCLVQDPKSSGWSQYYECRRCPWLWTIPQNNNNDNRLLFSLPRVCIQTYRYHDPLPHQKPNLNRFPTLYSPAVGLYS